MSARGIFITGTDTGIGKTWTTLALMHALKASGLRVAGMKPVASGAVTVDDRLKNEDALLIQSQCSTTHPYEWINPFVFTEPVAPHIAAHNTGAIINLGTITESFGKIAGSNDFVVVEGVGGWRVPLAEQLSIADMVRALGLPVLLVIGLRLGCINHALLTVECIRADGIPLSGIVITGIEEDYLCVEETLQTLARSINSPMLGILPHMKAFNIKTLAAKLDVKQLLD